jgi:hypothetical protein
MNRISVEDPVNPKDVANKKYVDESIPYSNRPEVLGLFYEPWGESTFDGEVIINNFCASRFTLPWTKKVDSISIFTKDTSANVDPIVLCLYECSTPNSAEKTFTKIYNSLSVPLANVNYGILKHNTPAPIQLVEGRLYQIAIQRNGFVGVAPVLQANPFGLNRFGFNTNSTNNGFIAPSEFTVNDNTGTQVGDFLSSASGHEKALFFRLGLKY